MEFSVLFLGLGIGALLGGLVAYAWLRSRPILVDSRVPELQTEVLELNRQIAKAEAEKHAALQLGETEKRALQEQLRIQKETFEDFRKQSKMEFEALASNVLDSKSKIFSEQTEKNLETLLKPLREKLGSFEQKVDTSFATEAKERFALKSEIERLMGLNERMSREAQSLTQALKGDSKVQGDWGEMILERVLEASGLRDGVEYSTQTSFESEAGERYRPDIIIKLPDDKHIVVDSKVSLTAYEAFMRCQAEGTDREECLRNHLRSLHQHIEDLGEKHYARLKGLRSPEFVFLFVPIEPAYLLAMQNDGGLAERAWKKGVAIVTSTTLLTSLKTVAGIWRLENQNRNALEIATEGAKLYDKFVGFLEDFERIGKIFESGNTAYVTAMGKLKEGPGNVFRKIERLRELGAAPAKRLKPELTE